MSEIKERCNRCKRFNYSTHCDFCGVECIKTGEQNGGYGLDWCGDCEKRHKIQECWFALIRKTKEEFVSTINTIKNFEQKASRNPVEAESSKGEKGDVGVGSSQTPPKRSAFSLKMGDTSTSPRNPESLIEFEPLDDFGVKNRCKKCGATTRDTERHKEYHEIYEKKKEGKFSGTLAKKEFAPLTRYNRRRKKNTEVKADV